MYRTEDIKDKILQITERMEAISGELTEIDSKLGDGDMGISMKKGAEAIREALKNNTCNSVKDLFSRCAFALNKAAPSTMGTLLSGALLAVAKAFPDRESLTDEDVASIIKVMAGAISDRGKAKAGDKTILDAMVPYGETMVKIWDKEKDLKVAHFQALKEALKGVESTKGMRAKTGRASWLGERNSEFPDAGAVMFYRIMEVF